MKLSQFENGEAIELLANILDPAVEIMGDSVIVEILRSGKPPLLAIKKALKDHKTAVIDIVAAMHGETRETVRFTMPSLIKDILELLSDDDMKAVFTSQSPRNPSESFGSATVNTEEDVN